jgi:DNA-binding CsgD family transcriptional regulator
MAKADQLIRTIEAIHAAGVDAKRWPDALAAATGLIGGIGATFEVIDSATHQPREWYGWGIPEASEVQYLDQFAPLSPRPAVGFRMGADAIIYDHLVLDETAMKRDPFYADFLARYGFRYFISANVVQTADEAAPFAIQRSPRQGHVGRREIELMQRLLPHLQQAYDVAQRLKRAQTESRTFERALDWLADGVALVRADGTIAYVNDALQRIFRRNDGLRTAKGGFEFLAPESRARFAAALAAIAKQRADRAIEAGLTDLAVARGAGIPPYLLSVRPLVRTERYDIDERAIAIVFVRDPLSSNPAASSVLREVFGFTEAESNLARALQSGLSVTAYANDRSVSINTAYTHLRRLKEKTGSKRLAELIRKLDDLKVPLREG